MTDLFAPAFLERQQALYPRLDVRVYAAAVREMADRVTVRNPQGLLVHLLVKAERAARPHRARAEAELRAEQERYAVLWAALFQRVAVRGLSPTQIARCLDVAAAEGFPNLNRRIAARLRALGERWPGDERRPRHEPHHRRAGSGALAHATEG